MDRKGNQTGASPSNSVPTSSRSKRNKRNKNKKRASVDSNASDKTQGSRDGCSDANGSPSPTDSDKPSPGQSPTKGNSNGKATVIKGETSSRNGSKLEVDNSSTKQSPVKTDTTKNNRKSTPETKSPDNLPKLQNLTLQGETTNSGNSVSNVNKNPAISTGARPKQKKDNPQPPTSSKSPHLLAKTAKSSLRATKSDETPNRPMTSPHGGARPKTTPQPGSRKVDLSEASMTRSFPPADLPPNMTKEEVENMIKKIIPGGSKITRTSPDGSLGSATVRVSPDRPQSAASRINQKFREEHERRRNRHERRTNTKLGKTFLELEQQLPPQFQPKERTREGILAGTRDFTKLLEGHLQAAPATSMCVQCKAPRIACGCEVPEYLRQPMQRVDQSMDDYLKKKFENYPEGSPATRICVRCDQPGVACLCDLPDNPPQSLKRVDQSMEEYLKKKFEEDDPLGRKFRFRVYEESESDEGLEEDILEDDDDDDDDDDHDDDDHDHDEDGKGKERAKEKKEEGEIVMGPAAAAAIAAAAQAAATRAAVAAAATAVVAAAVARSKEKNSPKKKRSGKK